MCIIISRNFHCNSSIKNEPFYKHVHAVYVGIQLLNTFFVLIHLDIFIDMCVWHVHMYCAYLLVNRQNHVRSVLKGNKRNVQTPPWIQVHV